MLSINRQSILTLTIMKNSQIRKTLLETPSNLKVRITRTGHVHVYTNRCRGDGGPRPWWMYIGTVTAFEGVKA
jgi:hypothetical protein